MPIDEVLMRDSCGKSRSKLKKYFYYNEYNKDNFPFVSDYEELTLLDLLEGTKSISDAIPLFIPYILIIILAIICIGVWISICCCSRRPKCFLKKDNIHTNRTRFICLMVFYGFALCIIVLGIVSIVYIYYAEGDFNGTICSLLMLQYDIVNGQGFLSKKRIYKPYWYGSTQIGEAVNKTNNLLSELQSTCTKEIDKLETAAESRNEGDSLVKKLDEIYTEFQSEKIEMTSPTGLPTSTIPIYISNLGEKEKNETYTGRIYEGYKKNFEYILDDIINPVYYICKIIGTSGGGNLSFGLGEFESVIENLNNMLNNLSSTITEYIMKFSNYIVNFGYKVNFSLFITITVATGIECILFIIYYFRPFSTLKYNIYIFIHIINLVLILCIIYNAIFGLLSLLMGNMADIVDAAFSKENLSSEKPRLIGAGTNIQKLARCLRGDGDLFEEFVTEEVRQILDPLTQLYILYSPAKIVDEKIKNNTGKNEYNTLIQLEEVINELKNMRDDFILSTTKETSQENDITTMLDEMTKYTMAGRRYQRQCASATYDIWTTTPEHCPIVQTGNNLITGQCKYLKDFYDENDNSIGAAAAASKYNEACPLTSQVDFPDVKTAVYQYILTFSKYKKENKDLINKLLGDDDFEVIETEGEEGASADEADGKNNDNNLGFNQLNENFKENFIKKVKGAMEIINEGLTGKVHDLFSTLLNDTTEDSSTINISNFSLFSWMNCSAIGQDYNATLSTLKSNLTNEMRVITFCSLVCELLLIANLYIMVGLAKNLRDKIFEINDARNVSHTSDNIEEIQVNTIKETKDKDDDEMFAIRNKKKFEVEENVDTKRGINVNEELDKDGKGITHPAVVSINGPDGRCIFENGENAHKQLEINNKDKEAEVKTNINNDKLNINNKVESKNLPKKKKQIFDSDEEKDNKSDDESSRKTKKTKPKNGKSNKNNNKMKSSLSNKLKEKEKKSSSAASSSSVSFG